MPARGIHHRLGALAIAALLSCLVPGMTTAAEWVDEVPPEPGAIVLPQLVSDAVTADLDGDERRELIRLVAGVGFGGAITVEAWKESLDGWEMVGDPQPVYREARVGEFAPKRVFTVQSELAAVLPREPARLLVMRDGPRERVLAVATGEPGTDRSCCLTVWEVKASGTLTLLPIVGTARTTETLLAVDLTGDGRDELLATTAPELGLGSPPELLVAAYRVDDGQLQAIDRAELPIVEGIMPVAVSAGDGSPREVAVMTGASDEGTLHRIGLGPDGQLSHETTPVAFAGQLAEAVIDGRPVLVISGDAEMVTLHWPPGGEAEPISRVPLGGDLLPVIGGGGDMRIPVAHRPPNVLYLFAPDLATQGSVTQTAPVGRLLGTPVAPYVGPFPGGDLAGGEAVVFRGRLLKGDAPPGAAAGARIAIDAVGSFAAAQPVGYLGDGDWMAVLHTLGPWFDLGRRGAELTAPHTFSDARLAIVPSTSVLRPEEARGQLRPQLEGAVAVGELSGRQQVLAPPEGFQIKLVAPAGSRVLPVIGDPPLPADARLILVPPVGQMTIRIQPPVATPSRGRYLARLVVVTPAGHAYTAAWQVQVRDGPPDLQAEADGAPFSFRVPISGGTEPGVTVRVDGEPVPVADDGSFSAAVSASIWPRTVQMEAVDPLGNRSVETLSVVGPIDYRLLPWAPIVALLTIVAAFIVYLRAPRHRAPRPALEGASLQELDEEAPEPQAR